MGTSATKSGKNVWFNLLFKRVLIYQLEPSSPNSSHRFLDICETARERRSLLYQTLVLKDSQTLHLQLVLLNRQTLHLADKGQFLPELWILI
jgi:hypothetical protein